MIAATRSAGAWALTYGAAIHRRVPYSRTSPSPVTGVLLGAHPDYWKVIGPYTCVATAALHPGSGSTATDTEGDTLGAIVFALGDPDAVGVHVAPASEAARVCAAPVGYEWLEILRPAGAPSDALPAQP